MQSHMFSRKVGAMLLVLVQDAEPPSDTEWNDFLDLLKSTMPKVKLLVVTRGGGPDVEQRKRLEVTLAGARFQTAVVSDSVKVRFVAATIALFHKEHRSFTEDEMDKAYEHLGLTDHECSQANSAVAEMVQRLP